MRTAWLLALLAVPAGAQSRVAGGVVSSREWHVRRGEQREEEFSGDVRYRTGPNLVRCDWALYKHGPKTWQLRGDVSIDRVLDSGDRAQAKGDQAFYDMAKRSGWLTAKDRVSFVRFPADGSEPDRGEAKRLALEDGRAAVMTGGVRLWGPRAESWSDRADYEHASGQVLLTGGRPVLRKFPGWDAQDEWAGAIKADEVRSWHSRRRVAADGNVLGWLHFREAPKR